ncbi:uncharacterized protein IUM83_10126 [Phytophthora cinnamomi]|uniref:uncharacterized protein n=1 Tax=Phytophthora cinnamomi TaxID=4785 RepID=UPI003559B271|nr:hypothetical protein IUM83_10126 [Phytophthora cinnamomi]
MASALKRWAAVSGLSEFFFLGFLLLPQGVRRPRERQTDELSELTTASGVVELFSWRGTALRYEQLAARMRVEIVMGFRRARNRRSSSSACSAEIPE